MGWFDDDDDDDDDDDGDDNDKINHNNNDHGIETRNKKSTTSGGQQHDRMITFDDLQPQQQQPQQQQQQQSHLPLAGQNDAANDGDNTNNNDHKNNDDEEEEEDALDAYMNSLGRQAKADDDAKRRNGRSGPSTERLDVENEEEATSHWEATPFEKDWIEQQPQPQSPAGTISAHAEASNALQTTFHRASNQQQQQQQYLPPRGGGGGGGGGGNTDDVDRQVNIQLEQVQHSTMQYRDFQKCFLPMEKDGKRNTYEGHKWRKEHHISCQPPVDPIYDFAELRDIFPPQVMEWNRNKNLTQPTLVQSQTLGVSLCGKDAIVTASTGSGKTLSYLWPLITHLMANLGGNNNKSNSSNNNNNHNDPNSGGGGLELARKHKCRALVLVPTRELALQVEQVAKSLLSKLPLSALAITGGNLGRYELSKQLQSTKPHLIVATPGRLLDVLSAQQKSKQDWLLPNITFLVLDEADKMIQMGFANQVTQIIQNLRPDRQSLLVSATFDSRLQRRCQEWMHEPIRISVGKTGESSKNVLQHVICLPTSGAKFEFLKQSLPTFIEVGRTIVFCAKRQGVEALANDLRPFMAVETLHGDKHPSDRKTALKAFTKGEIKILVATGTKQCFVSCVIN
jgi:superfamily II DNA/RNA helicase